MCCCLVSIVFNSLWSHGLQPARLLWPCNSPGKNTGVVCHSFPQGIFQTQGSNMGLLHCRQILYHLSHQGSPHNTLLNLLILSMGHSGNEEWLIKGWLDLFPSFPFTNFVNKMASEERAWEVDKPAHSGGWWWLWPPSPWSTNYFPFSL